MSLESALNHAVMIIENYQSDIKDSTWTGVDLVKKGFCQGAVYKYALEDIKRKKEEK